MKVIILSLLISIIILIGIARIATISQIEHVNRSRQIFRQEIREIIKDAP